MKRIRAESNDPFIQAPLTADGYLREAIARIDRQLGKGFAREHPELIAAFMRTAASHLGAAIIAGAIEEVADAVSPPDA